MIKYLVALSLFITILVPAHAGAQKWWETWDDFPKVPKVTAREVKNMMLGGEKIIFVYTGYAVTEIVCGSFFIPYSKVPPRGDGSTVAITFPRDQWIMCY